MCEEIVMERARRLRDSTVKIRMDGHAGLACFAKVTDIVRREGEDATRGLQESECVAVTVLGFWGEGDGDEYAPDVTAGCSTEFLVSLDVEVSVGDRSREILVEQ